MERGQVVYTRNTKTGFSHDSPYLLYALVYSERVPPSASPRLCISPRTRFERAFRNATGSSRVARTMPRGQHRQNKLYSFSQREKKRSRQEKKRSRTHECHVTREIIMHYITSTACVRLLPTCTTISINWRSKCMSFPHYVTKRCNMRGN